MFKRVTQQDDDELQCRCLAERRAERFYKHGYKTSDINDVIEYILGDDADESQSYELEADIIAICTGAKLTHIPRQVRIEEQIALYFLRSTDSLGAGDAAWLNRAGHLYLP